MMISLPHTFLWSGLALYFPHPETKLSATSTCPIHALWFPFDLPLYRKTTDNWLDYFPPQRVWLYSLYFLSLFSFYVKSSGRSDLPNPVSCLFVSSKATLSSKQETTNQTRMEPSHMYFWREWDTFYRETWLKASASPALRSRPQKAADRIPLPWMPTLLPTSAFF